MHTLYVAQQGCYVCLEQQKLLIKKGKETLGEAQLPLLEQVLIFGRSQVTTQAIHACLHNNIPVGFLSRMGYCYGRIMPIERGYRQLSRYQQQLTPQERLIIAQKIVETKLKNSRVLLMRQYRTRQKESLDLAIKSLNYFAEKTLTVTSIEQLFGIEGTAAAHYFQALGDCIAYEEFKLLARTRRPPKNPTNSLLSFGYQILWNHLLTLLEMQGLDPYYACLHQGSERHAALASDLIEEFRVPLVDSFVLWLINSRILHIDHDFRYQNGGCFLNQQGRKKFLKHWLKRMEEKMGEQPRWDILTQQIRQYKQFIYNPIQGYQPYKIR